MVSQTSPHDGNHKCMLSPVVYAVTTQCLEQSSEALNCVPCLLHVNCNMISDSAQQHRRITTVFKSAVWLARPAVQVLQAHHTGHAVPAEDA